MKLEPEKQLLLNAAMLALRTLEKNKNNANFKQKAEEAVARLKEIGLTDEQIHLEYYHFKGEVLMVPQEEPEITLNPRSIMKRKRHDAD